MNIETAVRQRHTVRKYKNKALPAPLVKKLRAKVSQLNAAHDLNITLVTNNGEAFKGLGRLFLHNNVKNYFVMAGPKDRKEALGSAAASLMVYCQMLGLNTWYAAATYSARNARKNSHVPEGCYIGGVIAVGYGHNQGTPHKSKTPDIVSKYEGQAPDWFLKGVEYALMAPTAMNRQSFMITGEGNHVHIDYAPGSLQEIDLGIVKHFFGLGAGLNKFHWS